MFAVFKAQAALANELEEELIDDAGGLEQMLRALAPEQDSGDLPQLRIDKLEEVIDGGGIARAPIAEKDGDFTSFRNWFSPPERKYSQFARAYALCEEYGLADSPDW